MESVDKMVKWLKLMLQSQVNKWSEIADFLKLVCQMWNSDMYNCSDVKAAFCFAVK